MKVDEFKNGSTVRDKITKFTGKVISNIVTRTVEQDTTVSEKEYVIVAADLDEDGIAEVNTFKIHRLEFVN